MFDEEKCPRCGKSNYSTLDYEENYQDDYFTRDWYCRCDNCKSNFVITYLYELKSIKVSAS